MKMRTLEWSKAFERDYKRERKTHGNTLDDILSDTLVPLISDEPLPPNKKDHHLTGNWQGSRECHVKPDLLLIYELYDDDDEKVLFLVRLGSHSKLFR
jgi:mRNA interferase YafQ